MKEPKGTPRQEFRMFKILGVLVFTALLSGFKSRAQCTIIANAIPNLSLPYSVGVNNATGVAFNPIMNLYYIAQAGNPGFPLETFDAVGTPLFQTNTGFDMRGLWWNDNTNQLESNGYNTGGIWAYDLNGLGYALNTGTSIFTGYNQPTVQSVGDYNCVDDEIWYYNAGAIMKRSRATNALIGTFPITGLPVGTANLNNNSIFYTDCLGHEIGLVDFVLKRIYFVDKVTMAYTGMSILPPATVTNNSFRASWANGMAWLFDTGNDTWYSFEVLTGFNSNCTVVICTPPNLIIDNLTECDPNTVDLNNAINGASGAGNASFYNSSADANSASNPISSVVAVTGTYWIRYEDLTDPTCYIAASIDVTINPIYNINESVNACENTSVTYPDGSSAVITVSTSHVSNLVSINGCDSLITTNVTMDPAYAISNNVNVCENATYTFPDGSSQVITSSVSQVSSLFSAAGCDSIITTNVTMDPVFAITNNINACENSSYVFPDGSSQTITANVSQVSNLTSIAGCDSIITTNVTMDPLPDAGSNGSINFCPASPSSDLFLQLGGTPDPTGSWSPALTSGTGIFDPTIDLAGTYTYTVTNPCGSTSSDIDVTITANLDPGTNGTETFCSNDPIFDLFASLGGTPDLGGTWSPALASGTNAFNPAIDPTGIYTYSLTNSCGTFTSQVDVTINTLDDASFTYPGNVYCISDPNPVATITGTPGGTFTVNGTGVVNSVTGEIDILASGVGGYSVTYTTNGLCPAIFIYDITILNDSDASITPVGPFCDNELPVTLEVVDGGGTWSGPGVNSSGVFDPSLANIGSNTITYTIGGPCGDTQSITIDVIATPIIATIENDTVYFGNSVELTTVGPPVTYTWTPIGTLDCDTCQNPIATPEVTTTYFVTAENNGCFSTDFVTIYVFYEPAIYVPNIFSPNGDLNNDVLYVRGKGVRNMKFIVYDRWGEKVFESTSLDDGWDGSFRGKKMNPAVFMYYLDVNFEDGTNQTLKGDVTLIR